MLEQIKAFCEVVKRGGLTKAARSLAISTPMVTRRIQQLELDLKAELFHRTTRQVLLTEAGKLFYQHALEMMAHYEAGENAVASLAEQVTGTLKIGLPLSISYFWVTTVLNKFYNQYPHINIHFVNGNHLTNFLAEGFDIVVHCGTLPDSRFYFKKIRDWKKITCAAPAYLKQYGTPKKPQELLQHKCIDHYDNYTQSWRYQVNNKQEEVVIQAHFKANNSLDIKNLAEIGLGIAYLPDFVVISALSDNKLVSILESYQPEPLGIYLVYASKQFLSKKTKVMLEFLTACLQQEVKVT
ncbi:MAG: hypothetical protein A3E87_07390 [Gammaproteobacteria bacterium RIFCSPHIGHO2_12_FULL_35_23]|nr:MAG: hypothetical protein A3E87_07390 [Gammaproteobacteria bacterium RIFCSPHIGHO2_12_FULL_35_23]